MKIIHFDVPKKVKKQLKLTTFDLPVVQATELLGVLRQYTIEHPMKLTVGFKITDSNGEEELDDKLIISEDSSNNLLLLIRQVLFSDRYPEIPAAAKEEYLTEIEQELKEKAKPLKSTEPPIQAQIETKQARSSYDKQLQPRKKIRWGLLLILVVDVIIISLVFYVLNLKTLAIIFPIFSILIGGGIEIVRRLIQQPKIKQKIESSASPQIEKSTNLQDSSYKESVHSPEMKQEIQKSELEVEKSAPNLIIEPEQNSAAAPLSETIVQPEKGAVSEIAADEISASPSLEEQLAEKEAEIARLKAEAEKPITELETNLKAPLPSPSFPVFSDDVLPSAASLITNTPANASSSFEGEMMGLVGNNNPEMTKAIMEQLGLQDSQTIARQVQENYLPKQNQELEQAKQTINEQKEAKIEEAKREFEKRENELQAQAQLALSSRESELKKKYDNLIFTETNERLEAQRQRAKEYSNRLLGNLLSSMGLGKIQ
ncbi:hypothetical protein [Lactococcus allomyrinae]|uniref:Uncharacterized protein n=1 Tax=Lactococcus allomyrinae TaxID=2419773 RepID=A0A387BJP1_9LACT|nr:hypothetical protein [Lactococcus allomyrinae]AYG01150.1 hypothetical protein D7I46_08605 [Lactococcus allomyrinae]